MKSNLDSNYILRLILGRLNVSSFLRISKWIASVVILNSVSAEDQLLTWCDMYSSKSCVNWGLNTKKHFIEVDNLLKILSKSMGQRYRIKTPKWAWLLCSKSSALGLSIYSNISVRLTCCNIRKLVGMKDLLKNHSWITGLRIAQSSFRANNKIIQWDWRHNNIKFCPILFWSIEDVYDFLLSRIIVYNYLNDIGFKSVGCLPCTRAIKFGESSRAGRWWWENSTKFSSECGLHIS